MVRRYHHKLKVTCGPAVKISYLVYSPNYSCSYSDCSWTLPILGSYRLLHIQDSNLICKHRGMRQHFQEFISTYILRCVTWSMQLKLLKLLNPATCSQLCHTCQRWREVSLSHDSPISLKCFSDLYKPSWSLHNIISLSLSLSLARPLSLSLSLACALLCVQPP